MSLVPVELPWGGGRRADERPRVIAGELDGERVLVPLLTTDAPVVTDQITVATTLARTTGATLQVLNPLSVARQPTVEFRREVTREDEGELLTWALDQTSELAARIGGVAAGRRLVKRVLGAASTHDADTLVVPGESPGGLLGADATERIATGADCDVVVVNGQSGYEDVASVLLPVAGGPHSGLAADVAQRVAEDCDAWIDVLHVVDPEATDRRRERAEAYVDAAYRRIARPETTSTWVLEADDPAAAIVEQSNYYGLTVVGAPTRSRLSRFVYGSTTQSIRSNANSVVLSTRNGADAGDLAGE